MYFKKFEFNENFLMDCKTIYSKKKKISHEINFQIQFSILLFYILYTIFSGNIYDKRIFYDKYSKFECFIV